MASRPRDERGSTPDRAPRSGYEPPEHDVARLVADLDKPTLVLRARVFSSRRALDEELAAGVSPSLTVALALRARQLVSRDRRERLATGLERLVDAAGRAPALRAIPVPITRREILDARPGLLGLAACLRAERPVYARGMALLSVLLTTGRSPVYDPRAGSALRDGLRATAEALDGHGPRERVR